ncbi:MAG: phosphatase PAP2 family protein [Fibrobacter sp.]|nr:phosphatase PAP2 family protein [Fibrobacter sp.]
MPVTASEATKQQYTLSMGLDLPLTLSAIATELTGSYLYSQMTRPSQMPDKSDLLPWDRPFAGRYDKNADLASDIGAILSVAPLAIGGIAWYSGSSNAQEFGTFSTMLLQSILFQSGINLATRSLKVWPRPYIFATEGTGKEEAKNAKGEAFGSFFSGHASAAFTIAVFTSEWYANTHSNPINTRVVTALAYSLAGVESVLRIAAGKHYPTDILAGAMIGTSVSYLVLWAHKKQEQNVSFWVAPNTAGITLFFEN